MIRLYYFFIVVLFLSCDYFKTNNNQPKVVNSVIDFTKVDVSPSFNECDDLLDQEKEKCFNDVLQYEIFKGFQDFSKIVHTSIDEVIEVTLIISNQGAVSIKSLIIPDLVKKEIPNLEAYIKTAIQKLPKLNPALKRGIPVTTQYVLPIHIKTE